LAFTVKLNVSVLSAVKSGKYVDDLDSVQKKLYSIYKYFPKRMGQLK
jgi:hypothetical protein